MLFKKKDVDTLIGKSTVVEGDIKSDASVRVDGKIRGNWLPQQELLYYRHCAVSLRISRLWWLKRWDMG
jgi:hypothetical protein